MPYIQIYVYDFFLTQQKTKENREIENSSVYFLPYCCGEFRFPLSHLDTLISESLPGAAAAPYIHTHTDTRPHKFARLIITHNYKSQNNVYHCLKLLRWAASCAACCRQTGCRAQVWKCAKVVLCVCLCVLLNVDSVLGRSVKCYILKADADPLN